MNVFDSKLRGVKLIIPNTHKDNRGEFAMTYIARELIPHRIEEEFKQENISRSSVGVIRGLHYQVPPMEQAKLVTIVCGIIYDVVVDLRPGSETFGQWDGFVLDSRSTMSLYIPIGFAHGFAVLATGCSDHATLMYKCSKYWSPEHERGIRWNDPTLAIDWPIKSPIVSDKDKSLPLFN